MELTGRQRKYKVKSINHIKMNALTNIAIAVIQVFFAFVVTAIAYQILKALFGNLIKSIYKSLKN